MRVLALLLASMFIGCNTYPGCPGAIGSGTKLRLGCQLTVQEMREHRAARKFYREARARRQWEWLVRQNTD